jgi:hypothetical protein
MPTDLHVRVYQNPYHGYEARFVWNGLLHRYSFELRTELACMLVDDSVEQAVIDEVMDSLDATDWGELPVYPLGVSYVGDAACNADCNCDACIAERHFEEVWDLRIDNARLWWQFQGAKTVIGVSFVVIALLLWKS